MSEPASPPSGSSYVPYQAYKSKRHSRNLSNSIPNESTSRPSTANGGSSTVLQPGRLFVEAQDESIHEPRPKDWPIPLPGLSHPPDDPASANLASQMPNPPLQVDKPLDEFKHLAIGDIAEFPCNGSTSVSGNILLPGTLLTPSSPSARSTHKKTSTFRRIPAKHRLPPPSIMPDLIPSNRPPNVPPSSPPPPITKMTSSDSISSPSVPLVPHGDSLRQTHQCTAPSTVKKLQTPLANSSSTNSSLESQTSQKYNPPSSRRTAPYPSGFQPKGVYRPLTDNFLALRRAKQEGDGDGGIQRVERTKLERRLEKLIALHFPPGACSMDSSNAITHPGSQNRRASSFFDIQNLTNVNINDAGGLWRGVVTGGFDAAKMEVRAAEQRITPWQEDGAVTKCPLCVTSFHPLTNRKHHCRLCGKIICSLPVKFHHRKTPCSTLFIVDSQTREIEEVGEGVDYGVKKRRTTGSQRQQEDSDKFLKGIRICRDCRPILLRLQYTQQAQAVPPFVDLYDTFINLETNIEESLPKFQELLMTLNHSDQPSKEASVARKHLLDSFAQYDKLSKKIRALPCPNGLGSSQDRVQMAIMMRANIFLQKNMFPLQSLRPPQTRSNDHDNVRLAADKVPRASSIPIDGDSQLALSLQPLLEQESLLEAFVEEAQSQRKFEDVKTLKVNLAEIRHEIDILLNGSTLALSRS